MQFRDHPAVGGKRDFYPVDPRALKVDSSYNVRDMDAADTREHVAELKGLIRESGVRTPLEVRLDGDAIFVVAGHCRLAAVMELIAEGIEIKSVPCVPEPKGTSVEERTLNLHLSNNGKPLSALEKAKIVKRLHDFGWEPAEIARRMNWKSVASVTQALEAGAMPEPVKQQVRDGAISATEAAKLVKNLAPGTDPVRAAELIKANQEENKRLGVGKRNNHKATNKTLRRDRIKPQPKAPEPPEIPAGILDTPGNATDLLPSALAATSESSIPAMAPNAEVEMPAAAHEPHPQLQAAIARENGQTIQVLVSVDGGPVTERLVTLPPPSPHPTVAYPNKQSLISAEIVKLLGRLATIAEDSALGERDPNESIPVPIDVIAEADRLYRTIIGDTTADEAA
jgi:ParB-like chromosome segregation protein Spo0J